MSMSNYPCHADTVEHEFVKEVCPDEIDALQVILDDADYDWDRLGDCGNTGDFEGQMGMDLDEEKALLILDSYEKLCNAFKERTSLGLDIAFHEAQERGDEVDGHFWTVNGVHILSPAGEKYKDKIVNKGWNVFG